MLLPFAAIWFAAMDNIEPTESNETNGADEILEYAIQYAQDGSYPPNLTKDKKRAVRKRAALLSVDKGEVFFTRGKAKVKVVVSHDEQRRVLKACHSEPTSGHFGVTKTYKRIAERFYWKGMIADVRELVSQLLFLLFNGHWTVINSELYCAQQVITCPVCQRMNKKIETGRPELHPIPIKSPWYHLGMDFVGPISPPSLTGNRYILTLSDYFTRFGWAKALPTKEAEGVVSALKEVCSIISDILNEFVFISHSYCFLFCSYSI